MALPLRPVPARTPAVEREATDARLVFFGFCGAQDVSFFYLKNVLFINNNDFVYERVWMWILLHVDVVNKLNRGIPVTDQTKCRYDWRCWLHYQCLLSVKQWIYTWMVVFDSWVRCFKGSSVTSDCCRGRFPWRKLSKRENLVMLS